MRKKTSSRSLFICIISTVVIGMTGLVLAVSSITITSSKEAFLDVFSELQRKIFEQIDSDIYLFYRDMVEITEQISENGNVQNYLLGEFESQLEERRCILEIKKVMEASAFDKYPDCSMLLVGNSGATYMYKGDERLTMGTDEILQSAISQEAVSAAQNLVVWRMESGFTNMTEGTPVIVFARTIKDSGIVYITIPEETFREMYSYFTSNTSDIIIFNQKEEIISTSEPDWFLSEKESEIKAVLAQMEENQMSYFVIRQGTEVKLYQMQRFQNVNYKILGIINLDESFEENYNIRLILLMTALITLVVTGVLWGVVRRLTRPLYELADTAAWAEENHPKLPEIYAEEKGTEEIRQLSHTYNKMMREINAYIQKVYYVEEEKRKAEIHALQMQIKPHYIYNTLASIKFMIWQNDVEKATKMIDAFILLLRNSISNTDKFVTVEQDILNLQNYVFINQMRYGDNVKVEYFVAPDCSQCMIPKLILQPFVENAFFHAFPENRKGYIHVFVRKDGSCLKIDVKDNGIGISRDRITALKENEELQKENFSGIGINNVDDRIKLMYGRDYGIDIESEEGKGTAITIFFPFIEAGKQEEQES